MFRSANGETAGIAENTQNRYDELGTLGLDAFSGFIQSAYEAELRWPAAYTTFNRIRRSDPEIGGIVRPTFASLSRRVRFEFQAPDNPTEDDLSAAKYGNSVLEEVEGGMPLLIETIASYVPFMGFAWFEVVEGLRRRGWRPPDGSPWQSEYDDGLPAIRKIAWRDPSTFERWDLDDRTGRLLGFVQHDLPNSPVAIPIDRSLHLTFGDPVSPEGLSPLEAIWRLERVKYGLEIVQGLGYQHAAGYVKFQTTARLSDEDRRDIQAAARAIMLPREGNFIRVPGHVSVDIIDTGFAAGQSILEAIRYYGLLKLQVFTMQWMAMSTTASTGALATHSDSSEMALMVYNAMFSGFADQMDNQIGRRLFTHPQVRRRFPEMTKRPKLVAIPIDKTIPLDVLSQFVSQIGGVLPMDEEDFIAIRRRSGFLPESLPVDEESRQGDESTEVEESTDFADEADLAWESGIDEFNGNELDETTAVNLMASAVTRLVDDLRETLRDAGASEDAK